MHSETSVLWNLKRLFKVMFLKNTSWHGKLSMLTMVTAFLDFGDFYLLLHSCLCFLNFLQWARILYIQATKYIIMEKKERKNVVCDLWPNDDLGSIFFPRTDGRPFIFDWKSHHSRWRAALKLTQPSFLAPPGHRQSLPKEGILYTL